MPIGYQEFCIPSRGNISSSGPRARCSFDLRTKTRDTCFFGGLKERMAGFIDVTRYNIRRSLPASPSKLTLYNIPILHINKELHT
ncbi:unnamed protein product [Nezara viridula]|uniref:Uncharacterized protein n=1 Tax=Nezara viridula TaxID=85310 RepID=A0A9P0HK50_NEZVI|nr:unnamed protein product [Nezara viridula]